VMAFLADPQRSRPTTPEPSGVAEAQFLAAVARLGFVVDRGS